jgi:alpha-tubulin suppressor-like RCC1 family protein
MDNGQAIATGHNVYGQCNVYAWQGIIEVSAGRTHTIGLDRHGRVYATGDNTYGQCDVQSFSDIKTTA